MFYLISLTIGIITTFWLPIKVFENCQSFLNCVYYIIVKPKSRVTMKFEKAIRFFLPNKHSLVLGKLLDHLSVEPAIYVI